LYDEKMVLVVVDGAIRLNRGRAVCVSFVNGREKMPISGDLGGIPVHIPISGK